MIKGILQQKGKINKVLKNLLKADVTIGELQKQEEIRALTFKDTNYVVVN